MAETNTLYAYALSSLLLLSAPSLLGFSHTLYDSHLCALLSLSLSSADISPEELESNWDEVTDNFDNMNLKED